MGRRRLTRALGISGLVPSMIVAQNIHMGDIVTRRPLA